MYNFIDITEVSEGSSLPSEALKINGEYIEDQIEGYRTLTVEGREALSPEVTSFETGIRDGSTLKGKRYPARIIRITYQLIAASNEAFREAYNKLASILDVTDAELIFNDEQDKFFTGTPSLIGEVNPGRNSVVGEFEITCLDPFKYSVFEHEAEPEAGESSILIDYNGTCKCFPKLQAEFYNEDDASEDGETVTELTGGGDCGYVAFFNESEKIIQLGDPDEVDGDNSFAASQTLVNQSFQKSTSWGSAAKALWALNSGITSSSVVEQAGNVAIGVKSHSTPSTPADTSGTLLTAKSDVGSPYFHYTVTAKAYDRTETSVKVTVIITARLDNSQSWFGRGYNLRASVYIGGTWKTVELKSEDEYWRGTSVHKKTFTTTISVGGETTSLQGIKFRAFRNDSTGGTAGTLNERNCSALTISAYPYPEPDTYYLIPVDYGTGSNWHGPSITRTIPADAVGEVGAKNFTFYWSQRIGIGKGNNTTAQLGAFQVLLVSGSGADRKIVAGVNIYKGSTGKNANLRFYVNGTVMNTTTVDLSYNNRFGNDTTIKASTITKAGGTVKFNICGISRTYTVAAIADVAVNEVTFTLSKFGNKTPLAYNGLISTKFIKNNCETWNDIPNKFSANDIVEADCKDGEIYLNGVSTPSLGALGNDWEEFYLTPGLNQIGFSYSEWVDAAYAPRVKVKYREVFL